MWKKGNEIVARVRKIELADRTIFNPTTEQILANGWEEYTPVTPTPTIEEQNEQIRLQRQSEYERRSDSLYMAYVKYEAQGLTEKANNMRASWLAEIEAINNEYPYVQ